MNIPQYILLLLVLLTTWGAFVEATSDSGYKWTFARFMLALVVPLIWIFLIVHPPFANSSFPKFKTPSSDLFIAAVVMPVLVILLAAIAPTLFVITTFVWVGGAMAGELLRLFKPLGKRIYRPFKRLIRRYIFRRALRKI